MQIDSRFWRNHLIIPLMLFLIALSIFESTSIDLWVADKLYNLQGETWSLKNNGFLSIIMHEKGRMLLILFASIIIVTTLLATQVERLSPFKKPLFFLSVSMTFSVLIVSILKHTTHVDCPWDLIRYGGQFPYVRLFDNHPETLPYGQCFPAGHAGGAYALLALYFFLREVRPNYQKSGFVIAITLGLTYGIAQQLRGAHFLSHDIWSFMICWVNSLFWYWLFYRDQKQPETISNSKFIGIQNT